ncbi:MAG: glycerophosphodiester phosphodiesterase family protein [Ahrensia sp.]|nr:glycerophosphodiester phosphodiesterase family protein [Ahrensia sp.]
MCFDATLDRITNQSGLVKERTAEELQKIKLGKTHDVIDTLEDVLLEVDGNVPVIIEMKGTGDATDARDLASAVAADLEHYGGEAAVMSFDHDLLKAFAHTKSKAPLGLTAEGKTKADFDKHHLARGFGIKFVSYAVDHLPNEFVDEIRHKFELPVITWTVRTPDQVKRSRESADQMTFEGFLP